MESPEGKCSNDYAEELRLLEENNDSNLLSSPSDSPPILRLQPSPILEQDNEYDSPVRTFRRGGTEMINPLLSSEKNDNIQNKLTLKKYVNDADPTHF